MVSQELLMMLRIGKKTGFTMIELMVAVVILTIGLVLILQGLSSGMFVLSRAQRQYLATRIAAQKLADLEEKSIISDGLDSDTVNELVTLQNKQFSVKVEVSPCVIDNQKFPQIFLPGGESEDLPPIRSILQQVDVQVVWQERSVPQELRLTTYFDKRKSE